MEKEQVFVEIGGKKYEYNYPNVARIEQIQKVLKFSAFSIQAGITDAQFLDGVTRELDSDEKVFQVSKILFKSPPTIQEVSTFLTPQIGRAIIDFFMEMVKLSKPELKETKDSTDSPSPSKSGSEKEM